MDQLTTDGRCCYGRHHHYDYLLWWVSMMITMIIIIICRVFSSPLQSTITLYYIAPSWWIVMTAIMVVLCWPIIMSYDILSIVWPFCTLRFTGYPPWLMMMIRRIDGPPEWQLRMEDYFTFSNIVLQFRDEPFYRLIDKYVLLETMNLKQSFWNCPVWFTDIQIVALFHFMGTI